MNNMIDLDSSAEEESDYYDDEEVNLSSLRMKMREEKSHDEASHN